MATTTFNNTKTIEVKDMKEINLEKRKVLKKVGVGALAVGAVSMLPSVMADPKLFRDDGSDTFLIDAAGNRSYVDLTVDGDVIISSGTLSGTGVVDIANLSATGTPGGSTYLRGDNTWSSVSASVSIGDTITSGTDGSVLFLGASNVLAQDNTNLFFNDTTDVLKMANSDTIGTTQNWNTGINDLGAYNGHDNRGYDLEQIFGKNLVECSFGGSTLKKEGAIRYLVSTVTGKGALQLCTNSTWNAITAGGVINYDQNVISVMTGSSAKLDVNDFPHVTQTKTSYGAHSPPPILNGGTF